MTLQIMSYNIRYNNPADAQNAWPYRKERVAKLINNAKADLIGFQEVLLEQLRDLQEALPDYAFIGVGRDDGKAKGEFAPIFYLKTRFTVLEHATFWLSETPDQAGSTGWDANLPRIVSWGQFRDKQTGQVFFHFNTHFDHLGEKARAESANLLLDKIKSLSGSSPVIVTGDFNMEPDSMPYQRLGAVLQDAFIKSIRRSGSDKTCLGFQVGQEGVRIDYVFCTPLLAIQSYQTILDHANGFYPSDHVPVVVELNLPS